MKYLFLCFLFFLILCFSFINISCIYLLYCISILENNLDKVNWECLSENINAISILENNLDKVDWNIFFKPFLPTNEVGTY